MTRETNSILWGGRGKSTIGRPLLLGQIKYGPEQIPPIAAEYAGPGDLQWRFVDSVGQSWVRINGELSRGYELPWAD